MASLRDVIVYTCEQYPHKQELSKARLNKIIYLADWRSAIQRNSQLTSLRWVFNHFGPYLDEVADTAQRDPALVLRQTTNFYGSPKEVVEIASNERIETPSLTPEDKQILDHVIDKTSRLYWDDFIRLVYSTFPIVTQPRYAALNLVSLADEYNQSKKALA